MSVLTIEIFIVEKIFLGSTQNAEILRMNGVDPRVDLGVIDSGQN